MTAQQRFNELDGKTVSRTELLSIADQAEKEYNTEIIERIAKFLHLHDGIDLFELEVAKAAKKRPVKLGLKAPAPEYIFNPADQCLFDNLECIDGDDDVMGLGKAVSPDDIYQYMTDLILETIDKVGHLPWQKDWTGSGSGKEAMNYVSGKPYTGANYILNFDILINEDTGRGYLVPIQFEQPYYLTFNQIQSEGARLKAGSSSRRVVYYTMIFDYDDTVLKFRTSDRAKWTEFVTANGITKDSINKYLKVFPMLKYYNVYRADDCTGLKFPNVITNKNVTPIEACQAVIDEYKNPPKYTFTGDRAYYMPARDILNMPQITAFKKEAAYYCTFFHEIVHSTGAKKRLDRDFGNKTSKKDYAFEELIAELGAVFMCGHTGILFHTRENSAKYLRGWNSRLVGELEKDNRFFLKASAQAQKAVNYVMNIDPEKEAAADKKKPKSDTKKTKTVKKLPVIGYALVDNVTGEIVASKKNLADLEIYYRNNAQVLFADMPPIVHEINLVRGKNKIGAAIDVNWKAPKKTPAPKRRDVRKNAPVQLVIEGLGNPANSQTEPVAVLPDPLTQLPPVSAPIAPEIKQPVPAMTPAKIGGRARDLMSMQFEGLELTGGWEDFMQSPPKNLKVAIWGKPKNGKTAGALKLAAQLSQFGNVLYNFADQGFNKSTQDLWRESGLVNVPNAEPTDVATLAELEKQIASGEYDFVFIDMISDYIAREKITPHEFKDRFIKKYPDVGFVLIFEVTKTGNFKGDQGWTHVVDAIVTVENFLMENRGRYGIGHHVVWEEGLKRFNPDKYDEIFAEEDPQEFVDTQPTVII